MCETDIEKIADSMPQDEFVADVRMTLGFGEVCTILAAHRVIYLDSTGDDEPEVDSTSLKAALSIARQNCLTDRQRELLAACTGIPEAVVRKFEELAVLPENGTLRDSRFAEA